MYTRKAHATREAPWRGRDDQPDSGDGQAGRLGVAERFAVPRKPGNAGGGKGPQFKTDARRGEGRRRLGNLSTPVSVQKLQTALHAKVKADAGYRFYGGWRNWRRDHGGGEQVEPSAAWLGELLPSRHAQRRIQGARQLHTAPRLRWWLRLQGQATQGRDVSTPASVRVIGLVRLTARGRDQPWAKA